MCRPVFTSADGMVNPNRIVEPKQVLTMDEFETKHVRLALSGF